MTTVLVVGATDSVGRLVVEEAIRHGYRTRALLRDHARARVLLADAEVVVGGVRNVLNALGSRTARIALMTAIGVTNRTGAYNRSTETH